MMKKTIGLGLTIFITATIMTGCITIKPKVPNKPSNIGIEQGVEKQISLDKIHEDIKKELGEDYIPDMKLEKFDLSNLINISEEDIEYFIAEMSIMSVHVDTFIAIKAVDGKAEVVEQALIEYRETLLEDSMKYPMNITKVNASEVLREGDYIFFLMLGSYHDREDITEEDAIEFALSETKKIKDIVLKNFN